MRSELIIGIDPGTTSAFAALDTKGNVLMIKSGKNQSLNDIISEIAKLGYPIAIGTDKAKTPSSIEKFAAATKSRIVNPKYDLTLSEKNSMVENYNTSNQHEKDALASALHAYKELRVLLSKIEKNTHENSDNRKEIYQSVIFEGKSIRKAIEETMQLPEPIIEHKSAPTPQQPIDPKEMRYMKRENQILRSYNEKLLNRMQLLRKEKIVIIKEKKDNDSQRMLSNLKKVIFGEKKINENLRDQNHKLIDILIESHKPGRILAKKLRTLGWDEFNRMQRTLRIKEGDVLFVNNVAEFSQRTLDYLNGKISVVLTHSNLKAEKYMPFTLINAKDCILLQDNKFAVIDHNQMQKEIAKKDILRKVVEEYQAKNR